MGKEGFSITLVDGIPFKADEKTDHRESSDNYHREIYRDGKFRIILCKDGIQWIAQRHKAAGKRAGGRWHSFGYYATKKGLMGLWTRSGAPVPPEIERLPKIARMMKLSHNGA